MSKRNSGTAFPIDLSGSEPLHLQIYEQLRQAILNGQLAAGVALPSTRQFATALNVSRTTVVSAYDQLLAEGYVESKTGAGTYVAQVLPDDTMPVQMPGSHRTTKTLNQQLSATGDYFSQARLAGRPTKAMSTTFPLGFPPLDAFPFAKWQRVITSSQNRLQGDLLFPRDPAGYRPLRASIAAYLGSARAVNCTADQIIIVRGTQQALTLAAQLLIDRGNQVWVENPGYRMGRLALGSTGASLVPLPVDSHGISLDVGIASGSTPKLIYVTPSHQFPLGITMKLPRRLALLQWAAQLGSWIIEDDYDSELRFSERPLPSLQGLDSYGRVIYIGTFNKIMFPSLRLGYMVLPPELIDVFTFAHIINGGQPPLLEQAALTRFIDDGLFEGHIRRLRLLVAERQQVFLEQAKSLDTWLAFTPDHIGMHLVGWLREGLDEWQIQQRAAERNVIVTPLSNLAIHPLNRSGLVFGYAGATHNALQEGIKRLVEVFSEF